MTVHELIEELRKVPNQNAEILCKAKWYLGDKVEVTYIEAGDAEIEIERRRVTR